MDKPLLCQRLISLDTKIVASVAVFTALAIALEPLRVPLFIWPGQYFHFWEIPIIAAFFLFGLRVAFTISVLDAIGYFVLLPDGAGIVGPVWRLMAISTVFLGLVIARKMIYRNKEENYVSQAKSKKTLLIHTILPTFTRTAIMPLVDITVYRFLLPLVIGHPIPDIYIISLIPAFIFFNIVIPVYSVPIAYLASTVVRRNFASQLFSKKAKLTTSPNH
jgi:riboflavin transporter FmnP